MTPPPRWVGPVPQGVDVSEWQGNIDWAQVAGAGLAFGIARVSDGLWQALRAEFTETQLVELVALTGFYHLISFATNAFRIPLESYAARFSRYTPER